MRVVEITVPVGEVSSELLVRIQVERDEPLVPWDRDICGELPRREDCEGLLQDGWWQREWAQINGLTIHHTMSHSPHATAAYNINKPGGRPSIPYHIWVTQTGEVLLCLGLEEGCWHDHTGHQNTHISVGLAGSLHLESPPENQLDAAAKVAAWAIQTDTLPAIGGIEQIKGHKDYYPTTCPGWDSPDSGQWKATLYERIGAMIE